MIKYINTSDKKTIIDIISFAIFSILSIYPGYINIYSKTISYRDSYIIYCLFSLLFWIFRKKFISNYIINIFIYPIVVFWISNVLFFIYKIIIGMKIDTYSLILYFFVNYIFLGIWSLSIIRFIFHKLYKL